MNVEKSFILSTIYLVLMEAKILVQKILQSLQRFLPWDHKFMKLTESRDMVME